MTATFRAHKGSSPRAEFEAHVSAVKAQAVSSHAKALAIKKLKVKKPAKPKKPKKMSMTKYKAALTKQITAALEASQGL
jgi:hypothetical protein